MRPGIQISKFWFQTGTHILHAYLKYDGKALTIENLNPDFRVSLYVFGVKLFNLSPFFFFFFFFCVCVGGGGYHRNIDILMDCHFMRRSNRIMD